MTEKETGMKARDNSKSSKCGKQQQERKIVYNNHLESTAVSLVSIAKLWQI